MEEHLSASSGPDRLTFRTEVTCFELTILYPSSVLSSHHQLSPFDLFFFWLPCVWYLPLSIHTLPNVVLVEILQLRSSCSMPVCPRGHTTRGGWLSGFGGNAQCWLHVNQYRAGLSQASSNPWIMTCSNERENSPNWFHLSHISPNKRPFVSSSSSIPSPSSWCQS